MPARIEALGLIDAGALPEPAGTFTLASHDTTAPASEAPVPAAEPALTADERSRRLVVGEWEDDYQGHRRLIVGENGTARMIVEPAGIARKIFAEKLEFEIEWSFAGGRITMKTLGGEPRSKANLVIKLYGTRAEYTLLNLDDNQLLLLDADGKTKYDWRRVREQ